MRTLVARSPSPTRPAARAVGRALHDRFLLPTWLWRDFEDVLAFLAAPGLALPADVYRAFLELRCPSRGTLERAT
jgi:uncharacterized protein (DUF2126 family)